MKKFALVALSFAVIPAAHAGQISTRVALETLIPGQTLETFEALNFASGDEAYVLGTSLLDKDTTFLTQGPNLVKSGASYLTPGGSSEVQWNNDGYFGLNTKTVASTGARFVVEFDGAGVQGFGVDLHHYVGFGSSLGVDLTGTATVFRGALNLGSITYSLPENGGNTFFFGWFDSVGITSVEFRTTGDYNFSPAFDDAYYGGEPVPEPATMAALALGAGALMRRRRR